MRDVICEVKIRVLQSSFCCSTVLSSLTIYEIALHIFLTVVGVNLFTFCDSSATYRQKTNHCPRLSLYNCVPKCSRLLLGLLVPRIWDDRMFRNVGNKLTFLISGFRRDVEEICALLGYYAASCGHCLPTFRDNISVPSSRIRKSNIDP